MSKSPDAFRTISEVANWLGIQTHVLRFWESKFTQVKPVKRAGGRRYYRPADMLLLGGIRKLLHDDGITIKGVQKILREQGVGPVSALSHGIDDPSPENGLNGAPAQQADTAGQPFLIGDNAGPEQETAGAESAQIAMDWGHPIEPADHAVIESTLIDANAQPAPVDPEPVQSVPVEPEPVETAPAVPTPVEPAPVVPFEPVATPFAALRPIVIDVAVPPASDTLPAAPGVLSALANLRDLDPSDSAEIAALAHALKEWHDRTTNLRDGL